MILNADCQSLSDKYGTNYGYSWGTAGPPQRAWWKKHNCSTRPVLGGEQDKMQGKSFGNLCQGMSDKYKTSHGVSWGTAGLKERGWWVNHQCKTRPTPAKDGMVIKYIYKGYFGPCGGKIPDHHGNEQWGDDFNFFKTASLVSTEKTATINLVPNSLKPKHSVMITGTMIPKESGTLTFLLESDDASYLIIEGKVVVDNGGLHPKRARTGTLDGEKFRRYPFTIFMGECGGANNLALTVTGAGGVYYDSKGGSGANVPQNPKFDAEKRKKYDGKTVPVDLGKKIKEGVCVPRPDQTFWNNGQGCKGALSKTACNLIDPWRDYQKNSDHMKSRAIQAKQDSVGGKDGISGRCMWKGDGEGGWVKCADEGGKCQCSGKVRYGKNQTWGKILDVGGEIHCNNAQQWGDPLFGTRKECQCNSGEGGGGCRAKDGVLGPNGSGGAHTWSRDENGVPVIYETCYDTKTRKGNTMPRKNIYKCNYGSEQPVCTATWLDNNGTESFVGGMGERFTAAQNFTNFRNGSFL